MGLCLYIARFIAQILIAVAEAKLSFFFNKYVRYTTT